jgi:hypothetical protein
MVVSHGWVLTLAIDWMVVPCGNWNETKQKMAAKLGWLAQSIRTRSVKVKPCGFSKKSPPSVSRSFLSSSVR